MQRFRFELILGGTLLALCAAVWYWQGGIGGKLTSAEVARYLKVVDSQLTANGSEKAQLLARLRSFGASDDGKPVFMVNLMRFYDKLRPTPGMPSSFHGTPAAANAFYEAQVAALAIKRGSLPIFVGAVSGPNVTASTRDEDGWSRIVVMRCPNRRAFFEMLSDPRYAKFAPFKLAALHVALVPVEGEMVLPEIRVMIGAAALLLFLVAALVRAVRRENTGQ